MQKIKKIKIYTHHNKYLDVKLGVNKLKKGFLSVILSLLFLFFYYIGLLIISTVNFLKNTLINSCFNVGNTIIKSVNFTFNKTKEDLLNTKISIPKRVQRVFTKNFNYSLITFLFVASIGIILISSLKLVAKALNIKDKIVKTALVGNLYLNKAKNSISDQDFSNAENNFALAYKTFTKGELDIKESGEALNNLLNIIPQKKDADRLLKAASLISEAGGSFIKLEHNIKSLKLTSAGLIGDSQSTGDAFKNINELITTTVSKISTANKYINQVSETNIPADKKEGFLDLKSKLNIANLAISNFKSIFDISYGLISGDKKILILFENNNELRASGGFMGTFGAVGINNGTIKTINVSSIYDLDGQLSESIKPPQPILNVSDKWYLRDSNWFANFPESAKKISDFYEKEGGETPDVIIAITPNIILDWLKITGPINLPKYGITFDENNFIENTQVATTLSNELPTNSPKQLLADLVPILLQKISELEPASYANIISSVQNNLNNKQIAIYSRDPETQRKMEEFNWTGNIKETDRDFLSVVSSNLGGTKTDLNIEQNLNLNSTINKNGSITNELTITRINKLPKLEKTNNLSFIRIYLPLGSKILYNNGFDYKNLEYPLLRDYQIDDSVYNWQKSSVKDLLTGTLIGEESGKTFVGNWLNIEGGETKTIKIIYELPFKLNNIDKFSLMIQKQLGANNQRFQWNLNFSGYGIAWKNFEATTLNTNNLNSDIILDKDYFQGLVLEKR